MSVFWIHRIRTGRLAAAMLLGTGALLPSGCRQQPGGAPPPAPSPTGDAWFDDVTEASGVRFEHVRGPGVRYLFPEIMSGGAALFDYDADGRLDLYLVQGGDADPDTRPQHPPYPNALYRNLGDGTFSDVTTTAAVGDTGYGMGCATGDYDGDGDVDLYVTNVGPNVLYRNDGDGTFTDVTEASGTGDPGWGTSAAFVDHDDDGDLDLFVVNYVNWSVQGELPCRAGSGERDYCKPNNYNAPGTDTLLRNEGDGTFTDASESAGVHAIFGYGLGIACGDFDGDGRIDIYVANDGVPNQLWINRGEGRFTDEALLGGCAVNMQGKAEAGMGVAAVDVEPDGDLDLFMTHLRDESNTFYLNRDGIFEDATSATGLATPSIRYTGFGMGFADFDLDGRLDLYIANGRVGKWGPALTPEDPYAEPNQLFTLTASGRFEEVLPRGGCADSRLGTSRAAAFGDLDNDGGIDIVIVNNGGPAVILRNRVAAAASWVMLRVVDERGRDAVGATVRLEAGGQVQARTVQTAYSYCAANDPRVHFGLGDAEQIDRVTVRWSDGVQEVFTGLSVRAIHELRRGEGAGPP